MSSTLEAGQQGQRTSKQLARFLVIGSLSAATDLGGYYLLTSLGMFSGLAKGLSFVAGLGLGWVGNKFWTFESRQRGLAEPTAYLCLYLVSLCVNVLFNSILLWRLEPWLPLAWAKGSAAFCATGLCAVLNFLGLRFFVFAPNNPVPEYPALAIPQVSGRHRPHER